MKLDIVIFGLAITSSWGNGHAVTYVPNGIVLADWITSRARGVTAFYDIDTPVTLAGLESNRAGYISAALIPRFDLYLSFTGGPLLNLVEDLYGSPRARALYCAA